MRNFLKFVVDVSALCFALILLLAPNALGQAAYGTIIGTVTDPSGAGVPVAKITVTDKEKGVFQSTTSNDSGYYTVGNLTPGDYKVSVEAKGFKTVVQENLQVIVGSSTTVNVTLEVGSLGQTITVDTTPPLIETDRAAVSTDLAAQQVESLPILNRNFTELELLLPRRVAFDIAGREIRGLVVGPVVVLAVDRVEVAPRGGRREVGPALFPAQARRPNAPHHSSGSVQTCDMFRAFAHHPRRKLSADSQNRIY